MQQEILGVDIGGVIIDRVNDNTDTSFFKDKYLESTAVPGALEAIKRLGAERFGGRVFLVSKCKAKTEERTRQWLAHRNAYEFLGILPEHVNYCRERQDKAPICKRLGITHFVDDKLEVLSYLTSVENRFLFNPVEKEVQKFAQYLPNVRRVETWDDILKELLPR